MGVTENNVRLSKGSHLRLRKNDLFHDDLGRRLMSDISSLQWQKRAE
jgi:hypothetical protein